jgi:hypothetical protein
MLTQICKTGTQKSLKKLAHPDRMKIMKQQSQLLLKCCGFLGVAQYHNLTAPCCEPLPPEGI